MFRSYVDSIITGISILLVGTELSNAKTNNSHWEKLYREKAAEFSEAKQDLFAEKNISSSYREEILKLHQSLVETLDSYHELKEELRQTRLRLEDLEDQLGSLGIGIAEDNYLIVMSESEEGEEEDSSEEEEEDEDGVL